MQRMLSKLMRALGIGGYRRELRFVSGPTEVAVMGKVASPNTITSPVTEMQAAVFEYSLGQTYETTDEDGNHITVRDILAKAVLSGDLVIETADGKVLVPHGRFVVEHVGQGLAAEIPFSRLPKEVEHGMRLQTKGRITYCEEFLREGDEVELKGLVGPAPANPAYPGVGFVAIEPVTLRDASIDGLM